LREVCAVLERIAPAALAQGWDNVGLLAGDLDARVSRVLLCIDLMPPVVREALRWRADLVVAYHPPIFRPLQKLVAPGDGMEAAVVRCLRARIGIAAVHTALDAAPGGTNDVLAALAGVRDPQPFAVSGAAPDGGPGIGRVGRLRRPIALGVLARSLARATRSGHVSIVGAASASVRRAVVVAGAAGSLPFAVPLGRGDVVVTGELRHHDALGLERVGACAIALGHWSSERPALGFVGQRLRAALPTLVCRASTSDHEPFAWARPSRALARPSSRLRLGAGKA
jgi:dinuclear metal center YbgI/SA1388 family protein